MEQIKKAHSSTVKLLYNGTGSKVPSFNYMNITYPKPYNGIGKMHPAVQPACDGSEGPRLFRLIQVFL